MSVNLMRRVVVAAVTSVAMFGPEIWWRGQKDRLRKVQLLLNSQAIAITGLLRLTPRAFLQTAACLPTAQDLLDHRQTKFAMRALSAAGDHSTHQLLPASFRFGELHCHKGTTGQPSGISWTSPEKTHRSFGSGLAQHIVGQVSYDTEYEFQLLRRADPLTAIPVVRTKGYQSIPRRMQPDHSHQLTLYVSTIQDVGFGAGAAWKEQGVWKTRVSSLGNLIDIF